MNHVIGGEKCHHVYGKKSIEFKIKMRNVQSTNESHSTYHENFLIITGILEDKLLSAENFITHSGQVTEFYHAFRCVLRRQF